jgi:type IX secretion system PorP/SprF family membrane protein
MKKILYFIAFSICLSSNLNAQQEAHFTQFMYNKLLLNPAFAGAREVSSIMVLHRSQWIGFDGAPTTQFLSFDSPIAGNRAGIGATIYRDKIGVNENLLANVSYSYSLIHTEKTTLKLGLQGAVKRYSYNFNDPSTIIKQTGDPSVQNAQGIQGINGNVGAGLYLNVGEFYVGASCPNIYGNTLGVKSAKEVRHYYGMLGGLISMGKSLALKPNVIVKVADNAPLSFDANLGFVFNKKFTVGASYRSGDKFSGESIDGLVHFQLTDKLGLGLAYDHSLSALQSYNKGSIEALLRYDFSTKNGADGNFTNPRFFF